MRLSLDSFLINSCIILGLWYDFRTRQTKVLSIQCSFLKSWATSGHAGYILKSIYHQHRNDSTNNTNDINNYKMTTVKQLKDSIEQCYTTFKRSRMRYQEPLHQKTFVVFKCNSSCWKRLSMRLTRLTPRGSWRLNWMKQHLLVKNSLLYGWRQYGRKLIIYTINHWASFNRMQCQQIHQPSHSPPSCWF